MSIYSGFATRRQQHKYNSLVQTLIISLKKRILKFYSVEEADEDKFKLLVKKIYKKMFLLERGKFIQPKYTSCFTDLIESLDIRINYDTISECSSVGSNLTLRKPDDGNGEQPEEWESRAALKLKVNQLEKEKEKRSLSPMTIPRSSKYVKMSVQNFEEKQFNTHKKMAESMFNPGDDPSTRKKKKLGVLIDLKELRGTSHMPKLQDFAMKRSQVIPLSPSRRSKDNLFKSSPLKITTQGQPFRRHKYVKSDLKIDDI